MFIKLLEKLAESIKEANSSQKIPKLHSYRRRRRGRRKSNFIVKGEDYRNHTPRGGW